MNQFNQIKPHQRARPKADRGFWLRTTNYYFFVIAVCIASFFLGWAILDDLGERSPWIGAGLISSSVLAFAVLLREFVIKMHRRRQVAEQARLDKTLLAVASQRNEKKESKLTAEQNKEWIAFIVTRSNAARVLGRVGEAHREVFEICDEYLRSVRTEITMVSPGSPRIGAFKRGIDRIASIHRFHMLKWAEIESRQAVLEAKSLVNIGERFRLMTNAESALSFALSFYPDDSDLIASHTALSGLMDRFDGDVTSGGEEAFDQAAPHGTDIQTTILAYDIEELRQAEFIFDDIDDTEQPENEDPSDTR